MNNDIYYEYPYAIEATNVSGANAHDFIGKRYKSAAEALRAFDAVYSRKGFMIVIFKHDASRCGELVVYRIVKSTYR